MLGEGKGRDESTPPPLCDRPGADLEAAINSSSPYQPSLESLVERGQ